MSNNNHQTWDISKGDYSGHTSDYDKLYKEAVKRESFKRKLYWAGAAFVTVLLFLRVLAYIAWN